MQRARAGQKRAPAMQRRNKARILKNSLMAENG
jgi:hypothetical protein